jgi:Flp pilus assembly protein TadG
MIDFFLRIVRDNRANVAMIFALALFPLVFLGGMAIDYTVSSDRQAQLNGFADAAALSAVTPTMMSQSNAKATTAAQNTFTGQASALSGVTYLPANLTVNVTTGTGGTRTAKVSYTAASATFFSGILGMASINLAGSATATGGLPPNIDFYLLLDDSPSMAIAATLSGIQTMVNNTASQGGCAFACHETHPSSDSLGNQGGIDNYQLSKNLGVTLRIDLLRQAAQDLTTTARTTMNTTNSVYRMAIYTFDVAVNTIQALTTNMATAKTAAGNISLMQVYANNMLTSSNNNSDADTNFDNAFNKINTIMPNPGSGTNTAGDTPQEVLFLVTDGVEDQVVNKVGSNCPSVASGKGSAISISGTQCRQQSLISLNPDWCTTIKNTGARIAVLYTVYYPLPTNAWYTSYIAPFQSQIGPTLSACASPGLYFEVDSGGDISAALSALFQQAVQSAYLSK